MRAPAALTLLLLSVATTAAHAASIAVGSETFTVDTFAINAAVNDTTPLPLDVAIDAATGNTIYMVAEFDKRFYSVARTAPDGTTLTTVEIQAPGSPLFRNNMAGADLGSFFSFQQERIATTSDGSVWVSQGGNIFYAGTRNNWSRIVRRTRDNTWEAYTLPVDSAGAVGFFVRDPPTDLWVMAAGDAALYHTRLRSWHEGETSAIRYPPVDSRWSKLRSFGGGGVGGGGFTGTGGFPAQLIQLRDRRLAGTLYFGSAFFLLDLQAVTFADVALATPPPGTTANSSGPWQIGQHPDGNLWIAEDFAKRVTKYALATGAQTVFDLSASLSADEHPHSLTFDGTDVYVTTYPLAASGNGRLVKITNAGVVTVGTSFATISLEGGLTGIQRDSAGALWVALFRKRAVARLTRQ